VEYDSRDKRDLARRGVDTAASQGSSSNYTYSTRVVSGPPGERRSETIEDAQRSRDPLQSAPGAGDTQSPAAPDGASASTSNLSGWWEVTHQGVADPSGAQRVSYRVYIRQDGDEIYGDGNRWTEDGARVSLDQRNAISIFGRVEGGMVRLRFTEQGRRNAQGEIRWSLANGRALSGSFSSADASGSGVSTARRIP
jgi:hypothetical protein